MCPNSSGLGFREAGTAGKTGDKLSNIIQELVICAVTSFHPSRLPGRVKTVHPQEMENHHELGLQSKYKGRCQCRLWFRSCTSRNEVWVPLSSNNIFISTTRTLEAGRSPPYVREIIFGLRGAAWTNIYPHSSCPGCTGILPPYLSIHWS